MNVWGSEIKLSIFGESHGKAVGVVIDGLPAGEAIDLDAVAMQMRRRSPGRDEFSSARRENDETEIMSGLRDGRTTGSPICAVIYNSDARSGGYGAKLRPGHADWTALLKYGGWADMRGGGHFSGRLTAPLTFAGSLARQIARRAEIEVFARIEAIGEARDKCSGSYDEYLAISRRDFPASESAEAAMKDAIRTAKEAGDSVGGIVEAAVFGLPGGLGEPFFGSMESSISSLLFSIPAVKGVEFGDGFRLAAMKGSLANDPLYMEDGRICSRTNHNGGILGGITNGMPLVTRAAIKPTPSIARPQSTVDSAAMRDATLSISGRHDPCIVPRAVPVIEACLAVAALDALLSDKAKRMARA
jgi:chorismate synthase